MTYNSNNVSLQRIRCSDPLFDFERREGCLADMKEHAEQQAFDQILECIFEREIRPGRRIYEPDLESLTGLGRTPVRHALARLTAEGVFVRIPGKRGYVLPSLSTEDMEQVFTVRARLEGMAAELAATQRTGEDLAELERINSHEKELFEKRTNREGYANDNYNFHHGIIAMSRNPYLERFAGQAYWRSTLYTVLHFSYPGQKVSQELPDLGHPTWKEHRAIIEALRSSDAVLARRLTEEHVLNTYRFRITEGIRIELEGGGAGEKARRSACNEI